MIRSTTMRNSIACQLSKKYRGKYVPQNQFLQRYIRSKSSKSTPTPRSSRKRSATEPSIQKAPNSTFAKSTSASSSPLERLPSHTTSTATIRTSQKHSSIPPPTSKQLRITFIANALPMVGFGIMDQTVMIQAGNAIDCSIGVTFGLSTLTAAAVGQVCSNTAGILFGGTIENLAKAAGLPSSNLSSTQRSLPIIKRTRLVAQMCGVILGCTMGLLNLLFIDTERSTSLKLQNRSEGCEFSFEVEASNTLRDDGTTFVVRGPDVDGLLASMTAALALNGCSILEMTALKKNDSNTSSGDMSSNNYEIEDIFVVVDQQTKQPLPDDELEEMANTLLDASKVLLPHTLKAQVKDLEEENLLLGRRIQKLEKVLKERQIHVTPSSSPSATDN